MWSKRASPVSMPPRYFAGPLREIFHEAPMASLAEKTSSRLTFHGAECNAQQFKTPGFDFSN